MALMVDVEVGQSIHIGKSKVTIESKNGRRARLRIDSTDDVTVAQPPDEEPDSKPIRSGSPLSRRLVSG